MSECSRKLCNEKVNAEFCSGYCELSHPLEEEIAELRAEVMQLRKDNKKLEKELAEWKSEFNSSIQEYKRLLGEADRLRRKLAEVNEVLECTVQSKEKGVVQRWWKYLAEGSPNPDYKEELSKGKK